MIWCSGFPRSLAYLFFYCHHPFKAVEGVTMDFPAFFRTLTKKPSPKYILLLESHLTVWLRNIREASMKPYKPVWAMCYCRGPLSEKAIEMQAFFSGSSDISACIHLQSAIQSSSPCPSSAAPWFWNSVLLGCRFVHHFHTVLTDVSDFPVHEV